MLGRDVRSLPGRGFNPDVLGLSGRPFFTPILLNSARFARGRISIDKAYTNQRQWPGRVPWGAIYPGSRGAYTAVGPHVRIWSLHIHAYCMLPDCRFESFRYGAMTGDDDRIILGTPKEARSILQKAGLNYFLFSRELQPNDPFFGTPLFIRTISAGISVCAGPTARRPY